MYCLICGDMPQCRAWVLAIEDLGEQWHADAVTDASAALRILRRRTADVVVLCPGPAGDALNACLLRRPPAAVPYLVAENGDLCLSPAEAPHLAQILPRWLRCGRLPRLTPARLETITCLARGLLRRLGADPRLRAWDFLPDMAALCTVCPRLTDDLTHRLYPLIARRHGMTPAAVERSLRLAVESVWSRGSLAGVERFFGHSVDPERGKPTNREFLCRLQERLTLAATRLS